jgi:hypothetical protein
MDRSIVDKVELPGDVFNVPVRLDILQASSRRRGGPLGDSSHLR